MRVSRGYATAELFDVLGVSAVHGRVFTAEEDRPGEDDVLVLSYEAVAAGLRLRPLDRGRAARRERRRPHGAGRAPSPLRHRRQPHRAVGSSGLRPERLPGPRLPQLLHGRPPAGGNGDRGGTGGAHAAPRELAGSIGRAALAQHRGASHDPDAAPRGGRRGDPPRAPHAPRDRRARAPRRLRQRREPAPRQGRGAAARDRGPHRDGRRPARARAAVPPRERRARARRRRTRARPRRPRDPAARRREPGEHPARRRNRRGRDRAPVRARCLRGDGSPLRARSPRPSHGPQPRREPQGRGAALHRGIGSHAPPPRARRLGDRRGGDGGRRVRAAPQELLEHAARGAGVRLGGALHLPALPSADGLSRGGRSDRLLSAALAAALVGARRRVGGPR